jgi:hypothetical protein
MAPSMNTDSVRNPRFRSRWVAIPARIPMEYAATVRMTVHSGPRSLRVSRYVEGLRSDEVIMRDITGASGRPANRRLTAVVTVPQAQSGVMIPMVDAMKTLRTPYLRSTACSLTATL